MNKVLSKTKDTRYYFSTLSLVLSSLSLSQPKFVKDILRV